MISGEIYGSSKIPAARGSQITNCLYPLMRCKFKLLVMFIPAGPMTVVGHSNSWPTGFAAAVAVS